MLVYKCDGESYSTGKKCASQVENDLPEWWLLISGKIKNGLNDAHYLECNGTRHFCSRRCLENFLFKDVNPTSGQAGINYNMKDPNLKAEEATNEQATEQQAAAESAEQDAATGVSESAEEGGAEG